MGAVAAAALWSADNERRSSRALRGGSTSFYAAEAGLEQQWAGWSDSATKNLKPADSVDLGWKTLGAGAIYHVVIHRVDNGGTPLYQMVSEGRGGGRYAGQTMLNLFVEKNPPAANSFVTAAIKGEGETNLQSPFRVSGFDSTPPSWGTSNCDTTRSNVAGIDWKTAVTSPNIVGTPPSMVDPTINSTNLFTWGNLTYDSLVARANITISSTLASVGPDIVSGVCVTTDNSNWGDPLNPTSACGSYFPIIHATTDINLQGGVGQGILLLDQGGQHLGAVGGTFTFYGLIISKGPQTDFHGTVNIFGGIIADHEIQLDGGQNVNYSSCVVTRALLGAGVTSTRRLGMRAWNAVLR
jgi:hypothetical protein